MTLFNSGKEHTYVIVRFLDTNGNYGTGECSKSDIKNVSSCRFGETDCENFGGEERLICSFGENVQTVEVTVGNGKLTKVEKLLVEGTAPGGNKHQSCLAPRIALQASNGRYVSSIARWGGPTEAGETEKFTLLDLGNGEVALRASNGLYVSADQRLARTQLVANRNKVLSWERFKVVPLP